MMYGTHHDGNPVNLQTILAQATSLLEVQAAQRPIPHSPITCTGKLWYHEDGSFECQHVKVPPDDVRTQSAVDASCAMLLIELAYSNL